MREVVIVDGARSEFGKLGGGLKSLTGAQISAQVIQGLMERTQCKERGVKIDSLLCGSAVCDRDTTNPARYIAQLAGLPWDVAATFVEMQCGSAITSLNHAAWKILAGMSDVALVGGFEDFSNVPAFFSTTQTPYRQIPPRAIQRRVTPNRERDTSMIINSDKMAAKWGVSREQCDDYAYRSQMRLQEAYRSGVIGPEIVPITIPATENSPEMVMDKDEHPRPNITREALGALPALFEGGVTTAGNASGVNDGAAFLLVMTAEKAKEYGYTPYAKWIGGAHAGYREDFMGVSPAISHLKACKQLGLKITDIDVNESNEAFAAQQLSAINEMYNQTGIRVDENKWNVNGGAIAIGHANGASGARISIFCMRELEKRGGKYGIIESCCGGGQGTTAVIENLRR